MLKADNHLINEIIQDNDEFRVLFEEHIRLEQDLEAILSLKYFPPEVETRIKEIKKSKLNGKDRMEQIISSYKSNMKH